MEALAATLWPRAHDLYRRRVLWALGRCRKFLCQTCKAIRGKTLRGGCGRGATRVCVITPLCRDGTVAPSLGAPQLCGVLKARRQGESEIATSPIPFGRSGTRNDDLALQSHTRHCEERVPAMPGRVTKQSRSSGFSARPSAVGLFPKPSELRYGRGVCSVPNSVDHSITGCITLDETRTYGATGL